jgi:4-diphosphocytidyl-2-C-methyl-D-erythritol kinase
MIAVLAPAKLNLTLEVLGKRPDGYHDILSVVQAISLCDVLRFEPAERLTIESDLPDWELEKSLVTRAARLLKETSGASAGAAIKIENRIPLLSGLGGGSSRAAATLCGLNELWKLNLSQEKLLELAAGLGSDVSFFLYGSTALIEGRGELVTPLPSYPHRWAVLVVPHVSRLPNKTAQLYASLNASHFTDGQITQQLVQELKEGKKPSALFNTFENVAFDRFSRLKVYRDHLRKMGAPDVHLAGSGPTLFTLLEDKAQAEDLHTRCLGQNMEAYLAETLNKCHPPTG